MTTRSGGDPSRTRTPARTRTSAKVLAGLMVVGLLAALLSSLPGTANAATVKAAALPPNILDGGYIISDEAFFAATR